MEEEKIPIANGLLDVRKPFEVKELIQNIKDAINGGFVNPLEAFTIVKRMGKIYEEISEDKEIKKLVLEEFDKYVAGGKIKTIEIFSAKISKAAVWTGYDFTECGHPALDKINKLMTMLKLEKEKVEAELKLLILPEGKQMQFGIGDGSKEIIIPNMPELIWQDSGEVVNVKPPQKIQKIGLKYMKV